MKKLIKAHFIFIILFQISSSLAASTISELTTPFRVIKENDDPSILRSDLQLQRNIFHLNSYAPKESHLHIQPWANRHWRLDSGLIAARYEDAAFKWKMSFSDRWRYIKNNPVNQILAETNFEKRRKKIDELSPAEKYDLLVGDYNYTLTTAQWNEGYQERNDGGLSMWMGICDGSAAASIYYPEPKNPVTLYSPQGEPITFHVMDIKALASLLWSVYNVDIPTAGNRCHSRFPKRNWFTGALSEDHCFDTNPASLHIALTNLIGIQKTPFIINRKTNHEVWNVPVVGYYFNYFNVATKRTSNDFSYNQVRAANHKRDRFKKYRAYNVDQIIGVEMTIVVAKGSTNSRERTAPSSLAELHYRYDLELDVSGNIIGGEWHSREHPDFMWSIDSNERAYTLGDIAIGIEQVWDGNAVPAAWLSSIREASSTSTPIEKIVTKLVELSQ